MKFPAANAANSQTWNGSISVPFHMKDLAALQGSVNELQGFVADARQAQELPEMFVWLIN